MFWIAAVKWRNTSVLMVICQHWKAPGEIVPDKAGMVWVGSDTKVGPPPADLLAEHHIHQLRVVVVPLQGGRWAVGLVVDIVQVDLAVPGRDGGDVDHPAVARLRQVLPQKVGQQEVGEMVALKTYFRKPISVQPESSSRGRRLRGDFCQQPKLLHQNLPFLKRAGRWVQFKTDFKS